MPKQADTERRQTGRKTICVLGTGYVGLPAAILLARAGHLVVGVDVNEAVVRGINEGILHIADEDLQALMNDDAVRQNLSARTTACAADVYLIAVPTPLDKRRRIADLGAVRAAAEAITPHLRTGSLVILESTVPPLTCREVLAPVLSRTGLEVGKDVFLAHCPERILPGNVLHEIVHNDRIIGGANAETRRRAKEVYASFVDGDLHETDDVTAELCKLMENTYRDVNIALANEFASVCETLGTNALQAIEFANRHPRVNILKPGIGVGGHCIPIDPWFISEVDPANSRLITAARHVNDERPHRIAAQIRESVRHVPEPRIVALGASYKPNVEDVRESPAVRIVNALRADGYEVAHYDPLIADLQWESSLSAACRGADCVAVLVEHNAVRKELENIGTELEAIMRHPIILRF